MKSTIMARLENLDITADDWARDAVLKMAEENSNAITVLVEILNQGDFIDRNARFGGLLSLLLLDRFEIYGNQIWVLYKDICGGDILKTIATLRAAQMRPKVFINA